MRPNKLLVRHEIKSKIFRPKIKFEAQEGIVNSPSLVCLFVLRFYGTVNPIGSCRAQSVYLATLLLGRISLLSG